MLKFVRRYILLSLLTATMIAGCTGYQDAGPPENVPDAPTGKNSFQSGNNTPGSSKTAPPVPQPPP